MSMFQVKFQGRWTDMDLPWSSLEDIKAAVNRYGSKPLHQEMLPFANLVRRNWGGMFFNADGSPNDTAVKLGSVRDASVLTLEQFAVIALRHDTLKLGLLWQYEEAWADTDGDMYTGNEDDGMFEVTILPAA